MAQDINKRRSRESRVIFWPSSQCRGLKILVLYMMRSRRMAFLTVEDNNSFSFLNKIQNRISEKTGKKILLLRGTLESGINVPLRLLFFGIFPRGYSLIKRVCSEKIWKKRKNSKNLNVAGNYPNI